MHVSAAFDSGNIEVVDATDPGDVRLRIRKDAGLDHMQWFHFRVTGAKDVPLRLVIENARDCSYPEAWPGYQACASTDRQAWFRAETTYADGALVITHTPDADAVWFAYFAPYSHERHQDLIADAQTAGARLEVLGQTVDGRDLDLLVIGTGSRTIWVIARQHPGESMAEWWMEGFLARLLDVDDGLSRKIRSEATLYVVPNMNPDGSVRGHLRNNAAGANLNREWETPTLERSPEVKVVRDRMDETGVDLCLDVHGDEELPYNFVSGAEGIPGWTDRMAVLQAAFCEAYEVATPDFQRVHGYPPDHATVANMGLCTNQVAQRFDCLAMTLEMPFKDTADTPEPVQGWSPERATRFGAAALHAISAVLPGLR